MTPQSSDEAFDARCAIELGVAASMVGRVEAERLAGLRTLMAGTAGFLAHGQVVDLDAFARHNETFHDALVGLTGNPTLLDTYQRVGVAGLIGSLLREGSALRDGVEGGEEIISEHWAIVDAFERADLEAATAVIHQHTRNAKETSRRALVAARGEL